MGIFSSKIELNNTIKSLEEKIEKLNADLSSKDSQITEFNTQISSLLQQNKEYEDKYIKTDLECEICYTTLQKEFVFCPKCGNKIEKTKSDIKSQVESTHLVAEADGDGCIIKKYNGFDDKKIVIPSQINGKKVIGIGNTVFASCNNIEEVIFEEGCSYIGKGAFCGCKNLTHIKFPKSLKEIGEGAFQNSGIKEIILPTNVDVIGNFAFSNNENLTHVILSEKLRCIPSSAFWYTKIEHIDIPDNIKAIGFSAFANTPLKEIDLPEGFQVISSDAFRDCRNLGKITIHSNVYKIDNHVFENSNPTIYCAAGSYAQQYARKNNYNMAEIGAVPIQPKEKIISSISVNYYGPKFYINGIYKLDLMEDYLNELIGGYKSEKWFWDKGSVIHGSMRKAAYKNFTVSEAEEIKRKVEPFVKEIYFMTY